MVQNNRKQFPGRCQSPAFQISLTHSSDAVCGFVVLGSFRRDLRSILTIAGRPQDDEAILCPFNNCSISSRVLFCFCRTEGCAFVLPELQTVCF